MGITVIGDIMSQRNSIFCAIRNKFHNNKNVQLWL
jgi:hypothetical protein